MDECLHRHSAERMVRQGHGWEKCDDTHRNKQFFMLHPLNFMRRFLPIRPPLRSTDRWVVSFTKLWNWQLLSGDYSREI